MIPFLMTLTSAPVSTSALSGKLFPLTLKRMDTNKVGGRSLDTWLHAFPLMPGHWACLEWLESVLTERGSCELAASPPLCRPPLQGSGGPVEDLSGDSLPGDGWKCVFLLHMVRIVEPELMPSGCDLSCRVNSQLPWSVLFLFLPW